MKVLSLSCANGHGFDGWFASDDEFMAQNGSGLIECPLCADRIVSRLPSAPRLNLSGARAPDQAALAAPPAGAADAPAQAQKAWLQAVRHMLANTDYAASQTMTETAISNNTFTTDATNNKRLRYVLEIDAESLDVANGFDCVSIQGASAANSTGLITYILWGARYSGSAAFTD